MRVLSCRRLPEASRTIPATIAAVGSHQGVSNRSSSISDQTPRGQSPINHTSCLPGSRYSHAPMTASSDPSMRYVLAEDAPYLKNLAALWAADAALARKLEMLEDDGEPTHQIEP